MADRGPAGWPGLDPLGRARVVGVLNVTPDSFSDGGRWLAPERAVEHGRALWAAGADLVDVGGESTRPGAARVSEAEESRRVLDVVAELARAGVAVSIDTTRGRVARAALDAGAVLVNDVSGGAACAGMFALVAERGCPYVCMHSRGDSVGMAALAHYGDVVGEVEAELLERVRLARLAGVTDEQIILDPGIGFAKRAEHNWALLAALPRLVRLGYPVLVGTSRKLFLGRLLAGPDGSPRAPLERDDATQATTALAAAAGVWGVRVHAVAPAADAVRVVAAWGAG